LKIGGRSLSILTHGEILEGAFQLNLTQLESKLGDRNGGKSDVSQGLGVREVQKLCIVILHGLRNRSSQREKVALKRGIAVKHTCTVLRIK
jgi:hypothetical protein